MDQVEITCHRGSPTATTTEQVISEPNLLPYDNVDARQDPWHSLGPSGSAIA